MYIPWVISLILPLFPTGFQMLQSTWGNVIWLCLIGNGWSPGLVLKLAVDLYVLFQRELLLHPELVPFPSNFDQS